MKKLLFILAAFATLAIAPSVGYAQDDGPEHNAIVKQSNVAPVDQFTQYAHVENTVYYVTHAKTFVGVTGNTNAVQLFAHVAPVQHLALKRCHGHITYASTTNTTSRIAENRLTNGRERLRPGWRA